MRLLLVSLAACHAAQPVAPTCPTDRKLVLASQEDVRRASTCTTAVGISVRTGGSVDLSKLRALAQVDGDLVIGPTVALDEATFPELISVGGTIRVGANGSLRGVYLPRLERAGRIEVDGNVALTTVSLPRLTNVDGGIVITDNAALELIDASSLVNVGKDLVIAGHPSLTLLEMAKLTKSEGIRVERAPKLPPDVVEQLGKPATP